MLLFDYQGREQEVMHPDFMFDFVTGNSQNHA
jgi:hypothetical protein